jgi:hypothetical protein
MNIYTYHIADKIRKIYNAKAKKFTVDTLR